MRVGGDGGGAVWEGGRNRDFEVLGSGFSLDVHCAAFGDTARRDVRAREIAAGRPHFDDLAAAVEATAAAAAAAKEEPRSKSRSSGSGSSTPSAAQGSDASGSPSPSSTALSSDDETLAPQWQGREVVFMRSNDHSRERRGRWDTSRLAPGPVRDLVAGDEGAPNWLAKLGVARRLLVEAAPRMRPDADALAAAFVYLSWVNSGALACVEGGGHHRPNHHARAAQQIFRSLEWAIEEDRPRGAADVAPRLRALLARRLQLRLPSFDASFTQSVPLTRIRDIAHRSDIPHVRESALCLSMQGGGWGKGFGKPFSSTCYRSSPA